MTQEIIRSVNDINAIADYAFNAGFMNITNKAQAVMKILAGQEMGMGVFASLSNIHIIQDKPVIGANMMAAAVKASPKYDYKVQQFDNSECYLVFFEKSNGAWIESGDSRFTMEDAAKAGLLDKKNKDGSDNNWKKYPKNMLFARAISNGVKWYCPDLFSGNTVYTEDELTDSAADIEGEWSEPADELSVSALILKYGAAAVMEANGGYAPSDEDAEALQVLKEKLETEYTPV